MEFRVSCDLHEFNSMFEENPLWQYKCDCGELLTNKNMPRGKFVKWDYIGDDYEVTKIAKLSYHCKKCWKRVSDSDMKERFRFSTTKQYIKGLEHYYIDDVEVTKENFDKVMKEVINAKTRRLHND